jgi:hypothetical protein
MEYKKVYDKSNMDIPYKYSKSLLIEDTSLVMSKYIKQLLNKLAKKGCINMVFTRFPYYTSKIQCKRLALQHQEGNCVAFAYYMKELLRQHKMKGYIVGGKPPPKFSRDGYREISHAGVILPYATGYVLFDTAFYFNEAIVLDESTQYQSCHLFTNVYTRNKDKWCFKLIKDKIVVYINDIDVDAYYEMRELVNPHQTITIPTNIADRTVFRCEINKQMVSKFYYKINLLNNILTVNSNTQPTIHEYLEMFVQSNMLNKRKLKAWIKKLDLKKTQKLRMYKDITFFFLHNNPFVS